VRTEFPVEAHEKNKRASAGVDKMWRRFFAF
jgi:hypothetical protein